MAAPTGVEAEIYASAVKQSRLRAKIRLDRPIADADFLDEFSGASLDTTLWSSIKPPNSTITVGGGELQLSATNTNGFPVVWSLPGKTFPYDASIGWTLEWTMRFPTITGFGVFFRVCDLQNDNAIVAIKCNTADGFGVFMPDLTQLENLGANTSSHNFELIYTPPTSQAVGQYELKRAGVSKGTISASGRQAWYIVIGNGSIQTNIGNWTSIYVSRVDVNLVTAESASWPDWTDKEQSGSEWWGYLPYIEQFSLGTHKRNDVDQAVLTIPQGGYISAVVGDLGNTGWHSNLYSDFRWANREIRIESSQGDGRRWTTWKEIFRGLCDEPRVTEENGRATLEITARDKTRRRLQMAHTVRGYSDATDAITGVVMNKNVTQIIQDVCTHLGLTASDYNVDSVTIKPRTYQILGESGLDVIMDLANQAALAVWRNAGQTNPGRLEARNWDWGSDVPDFYASPDAEVVSLDWAESVFGMTAMQVITVQHSEFGEFSDTYPRAPVPPFGGIVYENVSIAQQAVDINTTRLLPYLKWKVDNRELASVVINMLGQDWLEHDLEFAILDRRILALHGEYWVVDGWDYNWSPMDGWRTTVQLVNQHPEKAIMKAAYAATIQQDYSA